MENPVHVPSFSPSQCPAEGGGAAANGASALIAPPCDEGGALVPPCSAITLNPTPTRSPAPAPTLTLTLTLTRLAALAHLTPALATGTTWDRIGPWNIFDDKDGKGEAGTVQP